MTTNTEQTMGELQKRNLEAAVKLAQLSVENSQRILQLEMQIAHEIFEDGVGNARALSQVKTPQEAMELRTRYAQQAAEKMLSCSRQIAEITSDLQSEMGKVVSQQLSGGSQSMVDAMEDFLKGMPINNHVAAEALHNTFEAARKTLEQVTKASSEAFSSIAQATTKATKRSTNKDVS